MLKRGEYYFKTDPSDGSVDLLFKHYSGVIQHLKNYDSMKEAKEGLEDIKKPIQSQKDVDRILKDIINSLPT